MERKLDEFVNKIKSNEAFAREYGDLGPVYGKQWRDFEGIDQLNQVIEDLKQIQTLEGILCQHGIQKKLL